MLRVSSFETVRTLGRYLAEAGYDVPHLGNGFGLRDSLHTNEDNLEVLLYRTSGDTPLHVLARLFFAGLPVDVETCRRAIPEQILDGFFEAGVLERIDSQLDPQCVFMPFANLIVACDATKARKCNPEMVVGPSLTTNLISRLTVRGPSEATLDIGTGSGVLGLESAAYSEQVVGTDINERAVQFSNFAAALNGITNFTAVCGDALEPVKGQRFSRIIANPPFFLSPAKKLTYCDSPIELDGFCRRLAKEAPQYLEHGGFFHMMCEWVQVKGQPWQDRIREWVAESGCDVLVLRGTELSPVEYTEKRAKEAVLMHGGPEGHSFSERMAYFKETNVEKIYGGAIIMRKRSGTSWLSILPGGEVSEWAGEAIRERFDALDLISFHSDADLLQTRFRLTADSGLEQRHALTPEGWQLVSSQLVRTGGLADQLNLDAVVAGFIPLFNGKRTIAEIAAEVSASLNVPDDEAERKCLQLARRLLQGNFVKPV